MRALPLSYRYWRVSQAAVQKYTCCCTRKVEASSGKKNTQSANDARALPGISGWTARHFPYPKQHNTHKRLVGQEEQINEVTFPSRQCVAQESWRQTDKSATEPLGGGCRLTNVGLAARFLSQRTEECRRSQQWHPLKFR